HDPLPSCKDIAEDRQRTEELTFGLGQRLGKPVVAGSDTHQAVQYGCIRTCFEHGFDTFDALAREMKAGRYSICIHPDAEVKVRTASLLKRALKEVDALGGDYVSVLLSSGGESPAVLAAKWAVLGWITQNCCGRPAASYRRRAHAWRTGIGRRRCAPKAPPTLSRRWIPKCRSGSAPGCRRW